MFEHVTNFSNTCVTPVSELKTLQGSAGLMELRYPPRRPESQGMSRNFAGFPQAAAVKMRFGAFTIDSAGAP